MIQAEPTLLCSWINFYCLYSGGFSTHSEMRIPIAFSHSLYSLVGEPKGFLRNIFKNEEAKELCNIIMRLDFTDKKFWLDIKS